MNKIIKLSQVLSQEKNFKGVSFKTLATGERIMLTIMYYQKGTKVSPHSHPHEQVGFVLNGKLKMNLNNEAFLLEKGDSYFIPADGEHGFEALEKSEVIDTFSPPREDYKIK
ncbi:MAG: cupin domain-containing protein [Candidatus Aminicenantia bacterium]